MQVYTTSVIIHQHINTYIQAGTCIYMYIQVHVHGHTTYVSMTCTMYMCVHVVDKYLSNMSYRKGFQFESGPEHVYILVEIVIYKQIYELYIYIPVQVESTPVN